MSTSPTEIPILKQTNPHTTETSNCETNGHDQTQLRPIRNIKRCDRPSECCGSFQELEDATGQLLRHLSDGGEPAPETLIGIKRQLRCLPIKKTTYQFLSHQLQIVIDYLLGNDDRTPNNNWGAMFHLRLLTARLRSAKENWNSGGPNCSDSSHPPENESAICWSF